MGIIQTKDTLSQHLNYHNVGIDAKKVISISELFSSPLEDVENWA